MRDSASRVPISFSASDLIMVTDACEPGFTPQAARCAPHRAKSLFRSIIKTRRNKSGFYGGTSASEFELLRCGHHLVIKEIF